MKSIAKLKSYLQQVGLSIVFWGTCLGFFAVFRYLGIDRIPDIEVSGSVESLVIRNITAMVIIGIMLGIVYANIDFTVDRYLSKKLSLGGALISKTLIYLVITIGLLRLGQIIAEANGMELNFKKGWFWWVKDERFLSILLYIVFCSFVFLMMKMAVERFGKGVFINILMGKYRTPKEEKRIFMFLDLKNSTTIAEKLGHLKYSQFIQDCFYDLNMILFKHEAEIYQYVGDEAVLTWPYSKGLSHNNCVRLFFEFEEQRQSRRDHYLDKYGTFPVFKAGVHGGTLMVAEVGFVKKELAYHGDVINTSARIQAQCNTHKAALLLSDQLIQDMNTDDFSMSKSLGSILLKGKQKAINIYSVATSE
ncbi:MAG: adenylate/guanylate cyclase domain-containing protein [Bacteroidota bacterium]